MTLGQMVTYAFQGSKYTKFDAPRREEYDGVGVIALAGWYCFRVYSQNRFHTPVFMMYFGALIPNPTSEYRFRKKCGKNYLNILKMHGRSKHQIVKIMSNGA